MEGAITYVFYDQDYPSFTTNTSDGVDDLPHTWGGEYRTRNSSCQSTFTNISSMSWLMPSTSSSNESNLRSRIVDRKEDCCAAKI